MILTLEQVRPVAKEVVAERPDFQYAVDGTGACHYEREGAPSCVVGQILHRLGYSIADLQRLDEVHLLPDVDHGTDIVSLISHGFVDADESVLYYLMCLQGAQDTGAPWGVALERAEKLLKMSNDE